MSAGDDGAHGLQTVIRSATVSGSAPYGMRDKRKELQTIDMDMLLQEFKAVAAQAEEEPSVVEEDEPVLVGEAEAKWLEGVGLHTFTEKVKKGKIITDADIEAETQGLTATQVQAIKQRVDTLNGTLKSKKGKDKMDARDIFCDAPATASAPATPQQPQQQGSSLPTPGQTPTAGADDTHKRLSRIMSDGQFEPFTRFYDLSDVDQKQVQCLNLIQLTSVMEASSARTTPFKLSKTKKKKKKTKEVTIFGARLSELVERDRKLFKGQLANHNVPMILSRFIDYLTKHGLSEEGIFRKAGSAVRIKALRAAIEKTKGDIDFAVHDCRPHDVATLLKQFLRELCEPLLTEEYLETFVETSLLEPPDMQVYTLQLLVMLLPDVNRACLKMLLEFLGNVEAQAETNKMPYTNLAVVFAPSMFYFRGHKGQEVLNEVKLQVSMASTLRNLFENYREIWNIPPDIMAQIRFVNERRSSSKKPSKPKEVKRILTDRKPKPKGKEPGLLHGADVAARTDSPDGSAVRAVVSVTLQNGSVRGDVKVMDDTTVGSVATLLNVPAGFCLAEVGGNICCRRLAAPVKIMSLLEVNPSLTFVVMSDSEFKIAH
eukprot:m.75957 g.75957  ORF g.75957 m.75957 type:complete len:600 (-) comp14617_c0_seq2:588-2387(-)